MLVIFEYVLHSNGVLQINSSEDPEGGMGYYLFYASEEAGFKTHRFKFNAHVKRTAHSNYNTIWHYSLLLCKKSPTFFKSYLFTASMKLCALRQAAEINFTTPVFASIKGRTPHLDYKLKDKKQKYLLHVTDNWQQKVDVYYYKVKIRTLGQIFIADFAIADTAKCFNDGSARNSLALHPFLPFWAVSLPYSVLLIEGIQSAQLGGDERLMVIKIKTGK